MWGVSLCVCMESLCCMFVCEDWCVCVCVCVCVCMSREWCVRRDCQGCVSGGRAGDVCVKGEMDVCLCVCVCGEWNVSV